MKRLLSILTPLLGLACLVLASPAFAAPVGNLIQNNGTGAALTAFDFGSINEGQPSATLNVTLTDDGNGSKKVKFTSAAITPLVGNNDFQITGTDCVAGTTYGANGTFASCSIQVVFSPTAVGAESARLDVTTDAATSPVALSGTGVAAGVAQVNPNPFDFGNQPWGLTTAPQAFTVTNIGDAPLTITGTVSTTDTHFAADTGCDNQVLTNNGDFCTINVTFTPDSAAAFAGDLDIPTDTSAGTIAVPLTGTGVDAPVASVSPTSLDFGQIFQSQTKSLDITVTNNGHADLNISALNFDSGANFSVTADGCTGVPVLANGGTCTATVEFNPMNVINTYNDVLHIVSDNFFGTIDVTLSGEALADAPGIGLSPTSLAFPTTLVGSQSNLNVTVTNIGTAPLTITGVNLGGADNAQFQIVSQNCTGAPIAVSASCVATIGFAPTVAGNFVAFVNFVAPGATINPALPLSGTGTPPGILAPAVTISPSQVVTFGSVTVGTSSTQNVTVTNSGNAPLVIGTLSIDLLGSPFAITTDACSGSTLAPGANCVVAVTVTPISLGNVAANLVVPSNASTSPDKEHLTAAGSNKGGGGGCSFGVSSDRGMSLSMGGILMAVAALFVARRRLS